MMPRSAATRALGWLALLALLVGLGLAFGYAPRESIQGNVQRIMYVHVPAVLTAYLAFALVLVGSIGYLASARAGWDRLAAGAAELGVLFTGITIASGSIWGKPTWGTWWTWDARLTSTAILFLVYVYLLLRAIEDPEARGLRGGRRDRGRGERPDRALLGEGWRARHQPSTILGPGAPVIPPSGYPVRVNRWPSPCCSPTSCRGGWNRPARGADLCRQLVHLRRVASPPCAARLLAPPGARTRALPRAPRSRMNRKVKFIAGGLVIVAALAYLIYAGVSQSVVYFVTPSELGAAPEAGKSYRLGGKVQPGTLTWDPKALDLRFTLSDGRASVPVRHRGTPPDLFAESRGAVVEGTWSRDGYFQATTILAKHSEEYKALTTKQIRVLGAAQDAPGRRASHDAGAGLRGDGGRARAGGLWIGRRRVERREGGPICAPRRSGRDRGVAAPHRVHAPARLRLPRSTFSVRYVASNTIAARRSTTASPRSGRAEGSIILWGGCSRSYLIVVGRRSADPATALPVDTGRDARPLVVLPPGDDDPRAAVRAAQPDPA
jgi:heme exporter protein C